ncbi:MAG: hypothetical protein ACYC6N_15560 [Pirellulaceae bacterium]
MHRVFLAWLCLGSMAMGSIVDSQIFINEFHYDNDGTDQEEFVEVVAPAAWNDLSGVTLTLYNGGNGSSYAGPTPLSSFIRRETVNRWTYYTLDVALQNGAPDGLALALGNQVLQFLSYEGVFTATTGVAEGLASTDINVWEASDTPLGASLQLTGKGDSYFDFTWQLLDTNTYGTVNERQSMVPEPASIVGWLTAGCVVTLGWWRRRRGGAARR